MGTSSSLGSRGACSPPPAMSAAMDLRHRPYRVKPRILMSVWLFALPKFVSARAWAASCEREPNFPVAARPSHGSLYARQTKFENMKAKQKSSLNATRLSSWGGDGARSLTLKEVLVLVLAFVSPTAVAELVLSVACQRIWACCAPPVAGADGLDASFASRRICRPTSFVAVAGRGAVDVFCQIVSR